MKTGEKIETEKPPAARAAAVKPAAGATSTRSSKRLGATPSTVTTADAAAARAATATRGSKRKAEVAEVEPAVERPKRDFAGTSARSKVGKKEEEKVGGKKKTKKALAEDEDMGEDDERGSETVTADTSTAPTAAPTADPTAATSAAAAPSNVIFPLPFLL